MTSAIREISIQRGHDPRDFTMIAFGAMVLTGLITFVVEGPGARRLMEKLEGTDFTALIGLPLIQRVPITHMMPRK